MAMTLARDLRLDVRPLTLSCFPPFPRQTFRLNSVAQKPPAQPNFYPNPTGYYAQFWWYNAVSYIDWYHYAPGAPWFERMWNHAPPRPSNKCNAE